MTRNRVITGLASRLNGEIRELWALMLVSEDHFGGRGLIMHVYSTYWDSGAFAVGQGEVGTIEQLHERSTKKGKEQIFLCKMILKRYSVLDW
jgi:hypothetical protein